MDRRKSPKEISYLSPFWPFSFSSQSFFPSLFFSQVIWAWKYLNMRGSWHVITTFLASFSGFPFHPGSPLLAVLPVEIFFFLFPKGSPRTWYQLRDRTGDYPFRNGQIGLASICSHQAGPSLELPFFRAAFRRPQGNTQSQMHRPPQIWAGFRSLPLTPVYRLRFQLHMGASAVRTPQRTLRTYVLLRETWRGLFHSLHCCSLQESQISLHAYRSEFCNRALGMPSHPGTRPVPPWTLARSFMPP